MSGIEYLEMAIQGIRMTLTKLQQDPTQTPVTSQVGSRPKKMISQQDYNDEREHSRNQESYITTNSGPYLSVEQHIQIDVMLSMKFHEEEQAQFRHKISSFIERKSAEHFD